MKAEQFLFPTILSTALSLSACGNGKNIEQKPIIIDNIVSPQSIVQNQKFDPQLETLLKSDCNNKDIEELINSNLELAAQAKNATVHCEAKAKQVYPSEEITVNVSIGKKFAQCGFLTSFGPLYLKHSTYPIAIPKSSNIETLANRLPERTNATYRAETINNIRKSRFAVDTEPEPNPGL